MKNKNKNKSHKLVNQQIKTKTTTAIISRFMTIDLPYYSQWLEYHDKLGFDYFYLYYCDDYFEENLENVLTYYPKEKIKIIKVNKNKIYPNDVFKIIKFNIKEEYVLNIDSDEFLYLGGMNIQQFLNTFKDFNYFRFHWLMAPSLNHQNNSLNDILYDKKSPKYFLTEHKSMTKTKFINFSATRTPHNYIIHKIFRDNIKLFKSIKFNKILNNNQSNQENMDKKMFLIHFCYRDLLDCFYKQLAQSLSLVLDRSIHSFFNNKILFKQMPKRFLVYFGEILNKNPKIKNTDINLNLTSSINNDYLLNTLKYKINNKKILDLYVLRVQYLLEKFSQLRVFNNFKINKSVKRELLKHFRKSPNFTINFNLKPELIICPLLFQNLKNSTFINDVSHTHDSAHFGARKDDNSSNQESLSIYFDENENIIQNLEDNNNHENIDLEELIIKEKDLLDNIDNDLAQCLDNDNDNDDIEFDDNYNE